jgi:hypothetical protein
LSLRNAVLSAHTVVIKLTRRREGGRRGEGLEGEGMKRKTFKREDKKGFVVD